jgi:hypothetical protein
MSTIARLRLHFPGVWRYSPADRHWHHDSGWFAYIAGPGDDDGLYAGLYRSDTGEEIGGRIGWSPRLGFDIAANIPVSASSTMVPMSNKGSDLAVPHGEDCSHYDENTDYWDDWLGFVAGAPLEAETQVVWRWDYSGTVPDEVTILRIMAVDLEFGTVRAHVIRVQDGDTDAVTAFLRRHWARMQAMWAPISKPKPRRRGLKADTATAASDNLGHDTNPS